ncbi:MAG TPA: alanine racemase [Gammaproteobacteria bacterium]|jgi:D-serine deaminase-like pyridoxal phosphate-dependent protein|nr:alanine racemase [Gammaproteobacteria bacterium]
MNSRILRDRHSFLVLLFFCLSFYLAFKKNNHSSAILLVFMGLFAEKFYQNRLVAPSNNHLHEYQLWKKTIANEDLPLAIVDLEAFDDNLHKLQAMVKDTQKTIRIATKAIRIPELIHRALQNGLPFKGLMCYSVREASFLHDKGFDDFLIAYPTIQSADIHTLGDLLEQGAKVSLVVDDIQQIQMIAKCMEKFSKPLPLIVEFDTSIHWKKLHLGVRRSPIRDLHQLKQVLVGSLQYPSIKIIGVMAYEAIVAGLTDNNPSTKLQNPLAFLIRRAAMLKIANIRKEIPKIFAELGLTLEIFNGGGTGSFNLTVKEEALTEVTFGSGLLCPQIFDYYSNIQLKPAAYFALETTRSSDPQYVTCLGGGYIASGPAAPDRLPKPVLPAGLKLLSTEGAGEVQTPLKMESKVALPLGSPVFFRHAKAGELAEHFNEVLLVNKDKSTYHTKTYRGFRQCFL